MSLFWWWACLFLHSSPSALHCTAPTSSELGISPSVKRETTEDWDVESTYVRASCVGSCRKCKGKEECGAGMTGSSEFATANCKVLFMYGRTDMLSLSLSSLVTLTQDELVEGIREERDWGMNMNYVCMYEFGKGTGPSSYVQYLSPWKGNGSI
jgi:hypothetical protein